MSIDVNEKFFVRLSVDELCDIIKKVLDISSKQRSAFVIECVNRSLSSIDNIYNEMIK